MKASKLTVIKLTALAAALAGTLQPCSSEVRGGDAGQRPYTLPQVVRMVGEAHFGTSRLKAASFDEFARSLPVNANFKKRAGVFVTLSRHGKTRACWGSIFPQHATIVEDTVFAALGALTKEYRYRPIKKDEWEKLKVQVTVVQAVEPIADIRRQNPLRDGLFVRAGGRTGVLLPGEASDAYYQLVQCKLKAGIPARQSCQLYRLRTDIYE